MAFSVFEQFRSHFPADRATRFLETGEGKIFSYADLEAISGRYAHLLRAMGVTRGDRVAVQVEKSPEAAFLYVACLRAGAIFLPLNTAYQKGELAYLMGDAEPRLVVVRPGTETLFSDIAPPAAPYGILTLGEHGEGTLPERAAGLPADFATEALEADDIAAILYTSGTTGRPKGAMLTQRNLASNAETLCRVWGFRPSDVLLHALPIFHAHGLFVALNCTLRAGSSMIYLPRFDADRTVALLPRATVFMGVPTYYVRLLQHPGFTRELAAHMRLFVSGSAPLLPDTFNSFAERVGQRIVERYGMTETVMNTSNPLDGERLPGSVGPALPGIEIRIADDKGRVLPVGEVGVIEVRGPNVFKGYWRNPEKTKAEFRDDGFFITGDTGRLDENGYVWILGRAKDLVISGGYNVYPKEVETVIDGLAGVEESAVIGVPHPDFGEGVTAVVVREPGSGIDEKTVVASLADRLARYKQPKRVIFVDELPRNTMGKVQKNVLRDTYANLFRENEQAGS